MARNLDLTALRSFVAVSDTGGVTRAAAQLNLTQSAVSMQLKRLEESLGQPLFERAGRGMRLTAAGEEVYQTCHVLFSTFEELDERLARQSEDQGAEARVAVTQ